MKEFITIAENVKLNYKLTAKKIDISTDGYIYITTDHIPCSYPELTPQYLEVLCRNYYKEKTGIPNNITDVIGRECSCGFNHEIYRLLDMHKDRVTFIRTNG